jgi:Fe2+ or Zn2+ uptake regulation protein
MGKSEVLDVLLHERLCANDSFFSVKDIHSFLSESGESIRIEQVYKSIRKLKKDGQIETIEKGSWRNKYRLKERSFKKLKSLNKNGGKNLNYPII